MSRESRQRLREEAKRQEIRFALRKNLFRALPFIGVAFIGLTVFAEVHQRPQKTDAKVAVQSSLFKQPETLKELLALSPAELEHCDIARMNLLCAEGLPGAENLNVGAELVTLDQWAQHVKSETDRNLHHYFENPTYYYNSTNFFKMLMMAVVLYDDYGIRYNPKWIESPDAARPGDHFFADSSDIFLYGLVGASRIGTCSSMPVLYVALARRLGYPVRLVSTRGHLFMRWDGPAEKFNMDATGKGLNEYGDEHYKQWPFPVSDDEIKAEGYLKSMTPAEELSVFLSIRGLCLREAGRLKDAIAAHAAALKFAPNWRSNQILLADAEQQYAGIPSTAIAGAQSKFRNHQEEAEFYVRQAKLASRLRRAELGIPEAPSVHVPTPSDPTPTIIPK